jgi:hypothetical protein
MEFKRNYINMLSRIRSRREQDERAFSKRRKPGLGARAKDEISTTLEKEEFDPVAYMAEIRDFVGDIKKGTGSDLTESTRPQARPEGFAEELGLGLEHGVSMRPKQRPFEMYTEGEMDSFKEKLIMSESSGKSDAVYTDTQGRSYVGLGQFGEARLKDFKNATGKNFTQEQFKNDPDLQMEVLNWHLRDLDKWISTVDKEGKWDKEGLMAVGHLGGKEGMKKFVETGGEYNPEDALKTSLWDYYNKFSN